MKNISTEEKQIIKLFLSMKIPPYIRDTNVCGWDLMECYEEQFNYSHSLLNNIPTNLEMNSFGTGKSFIFEQENKDILISISKENGYDLQIYCFLSLATLSILERLKLT